VTEEALITCTPDWVTVSVRAWLPAPVELPAVMVTGKVPNRSGVPEMKPVAASTESPNGKPLAPNVTGLLVAVIW